MTARDELDRACRDESEWAIALHDDARAWVLGDEQELTAAQFLNTAYGYALARLDRERLQDELWGPEP